MKFKLIDYHRNNHKVSKKCHMFGLTLSGYYQWKNHGKSRREMENEFLLEMIKKTYEGNKGVYGCPRITQSLNQQFISCSQPRIARLMRENVMLANTQRKFKATTNLKHRLPIAPNLVNQDFGADGPNRLWVGDITYVGTDEGWMYLAKVMDVFNRETIGWSVDKRIAKSLVKTAMLRAINKRNPTGSPIFHSDRGNQYASYAFRRLLAANRIRQSMSGKGNCYDNAIAESFFETLKTELIYQNKYQTRQEAKQDLFEHIEVFYNRKRLHSALGYMTPVGYGK